MSRRQPVRLVEAAAALHVRASSGTSICTDSMLRRSQAGSNRPLAKRSARMFWTASLPRKWSIRNTCSSSTTLLEGGVELAADSRSRPNGFSTTSRARSVSPSRPSIAIMSRIAAGGTER